MEYRTTFRCRRAASVSRRIPILQVCLSFLKADRPPHRPGRQNLNFVNTIGEIPDLVERVPGRHRDESLPHGIGNSDFDVKTMFDGAIHGDAIADRGGGRTGCQRNKNDRTAQSQKAAREDFIVLKTGLKTGAASVIDGRQQSYGNASAD